MSTRSRAPSSYPTSLLPPLTTERASHVSPDAAPHLDLGVEHPPTVPIEVSRKRCSFVHSDPYGGTFRARIGSDLPEWTYLTISVLDEIQDTVDKLPLHASKCRMSARRRRRDRPLASRGYSTRQTSSSTMSRHDAPSLARASLRATQQDHPMYPSPNANHCVQVCRMWCGRRRSKGVRTGA